MSKPMNEPRNPTIVGNKVRVVAYIDPDIFAALDKKRGRRSVSAFIERTLEMKLFENSN